MRTLRRALLLTCSLLASACGDVAPASEPDSGDGAPAPERDSGSDLCECPPGQQPLEDTHGDGHCHCEFAVVVEMDAGPGTGNDGGADAGDAAVPDPEALRALLRLPSHLELPHIPEHNPLTSEKITLGRHLFYDTRLSGNETQSCGGCHEQELAFADGKRTPTGSTGDVLVRNSQGLANTAYFTTLTWANNGLLALEDQIRVPLLGDDPIELGLTDAVRDEVLARFGTDPDYVKMFAAAYPESFDRDSPTPTLNMVVFALASFCRTIISGDSPYDHYLQGNREALTEQQRRGLALFNGERFECFHCHSGVNLTTSYRDYDSPEDALIYPFFNNGLYNLDGGSYPPQDQGLFDLTLNERHRGLFRPPSLRNVALTQPYMHDGSIATLEEVVRHYAAGGRVIEDSPLAGDGRQNPQKSGLVRAFPATDEEIADVVAFLESLTDPTFVTDPEFSNPFE